MANIEKSEHGTYRVRIRPPDGRSRSKSYKRRVEADALAATAREARKEGVGLSRVLEHDWQTDREGFKSRLRRLKERRSIQGHGRSILPEPTLDLWQAHRAEQAKET